MSNPLDDKIKEALENFEMPYDAGAWAQLEHQLPTSTPPASAGSSSAWKIAAVIAVVGSIATAIWFTNADDTEVAEEANRTENIYEQPEKTVVKPLQVEELENEVVESTEEVETIAEEDKTDSEELATSETKSKEKVDENDISLPVIVEEENRKLEEDVKAVPTIPEQTPVVVDFIASNLTACVGQDVSFINQSKTNGAAMTWDFGDGATSTDLNPSHVYLIAGTYNVTLKAEGESAKERSMTIKVNPSPAPLMSSDRKLNGYQAIPLYEFTTATQPNERAVWSISDGSSFVGNNNTHLFREEGEHTVRLTVSNALGCSNSVETKISCGEFNLLAPAAFTPNGDGINETFIPEALPVMGVDFEMSIQNPRTGQVVYRTGNAMDPWNGKLNNTSQKLENGVYVWTVVIKEDVVKNKVFNGKINLQP